MRRAPAKPVRACTLRNWCLVSHVTFEAPLHTSHLTVFTLHTAHSTLHSSPHCTLRTSHSTLFTLHTAPFAVNTSHFTLHTSHFTVHTSYFTLHTSQYYFVLQSLDKALPSTTSYYKASTLHFPVLLCTTKLAQNTFQYYFVLQSLHKTLPSTTLHCKACKHFRRTRRTETTPATPAAHTTTHGMQHSCSHSNAICHHSFKKRIELRTQEQPLVAKHIGGTIRDRNDPSRTRCTDEVPFIAGCSHFTRKNTRFRAPASSPQHSPCNIHAATTLHFAASRSKPAPIYGRGNTK